MNPRVANSGAARAPSFISHGRFPHPLTAGALEWTSIHGRAAMPTPQELESRLWDAIRSDRTVMLGLDAVEGGHARPMTAQREDEDPRGTLWFFTSTENVLVRSLGTATHAHLSFVAKDHDLFASVGGTLHREESRATIDRLWSPFVAAWFEGGKDDPKLALLRFEGEHAEIWENASSLLTGIKVLFGADPQRDYRDKVARVDLH